MNKNSDLCDYDNIPSYYQENQIKSTKAKARANRRAAAKNIDPSVKPLVALNAAQQDLIDSINESSQVFAIGPAGSGKTYIMARMAIKELVNGTKERIIVSRVTVTKTKHRLGFRPGTQDEKIADWMTPVLDGFHAEASKQTITKFLDEKRIEFLPFETMRGRSLSNCIMILDEAQNCDIGDLRMYLTRVGEGTKVFIAGDPDQTDIPDSGLDTILSMVEKHKITAEIIDFTEDDVVRSKIAKEWVIAFNAERV